ncbi:exodeoxyribonuclease III [Dasania sp. GY-MA-18]|uniref:Exodeoxyribonuclease III n=1 Tax=Dasania phycosphaerae TaxID=2950436 RepID=A0A9J6RPV4_9GAMM|nr:MULTISPECIES: exodeoxyribonuclease III [Dasania]MCR8923766.1 exodeoxyribonuclease III [Dasania sp. GY-MA-18]MCZ0866200.1 exodeoxyribonuclease III [Dasania phycosphaerae]MCZ0869924.1 exodeoxyribonuclease III [Dasania phycosphaerae]
MRIISFCADGIREAAKAGFYDWVLDQDADFICVQNLQAQEYDLHDDIFFPQGYNPYFFDAVEPNSNGVAIYCRDMPKAIMTGLGFMDFDMEGRYIQADFQNISIGCLLAPSAYQQDAKAQHHKKHFFELFQAHLSKIRNKRREFVICGNWNMAHRDKDVENAAQSLNQSGFLPEEQQWMDQLFSNMGYVDAFREVNDDNDEFTWWPDGDRNSGDGWRVDYQVVSSGLQPVIEYGAIYKNQVFSSHAPVIMDFDFEM